MTDGADMTAPVTRGEMHQALETWAHVIIEKMTATLTAAIDQLKHDIAIEIGRATKASAEELENRLRPMWMQAIGVERERSHDELRAVDDQYKTLPDRVQKLEQAVFKPRSKRRAKG